jgi:hypothetical protein
MLSIDDAEGLIEDLASRLAPPARAAFVRKAMDVVSALPPGAIGPGSLHRALSPVWSQYFQPPPGAGATTWSTGSLTRRKQRNKLLAGYGDEW